MIRILVELVRAEFTLLEVFACVGVYLFWCIAYWFMLKDGRKTGLYGAPIAAVALMWSYETSFLFVWRVPFPWWQALEWVWFTADTLLLVQCVRYARATIVQPLLARHAAIAVVWAAAATFAGLSTFVHYFQLTNGIVPAVIAVSGVAVLYPFFALQREGADHVSRRAQVFRVLGDVCTALCVWLLFPFSGDVDQTEAMSLNNVYVDTMIAVMLVSDAVLLAILHHRPSRAVAVPAEAPLAVPESARA